ncbi:uncharacterized protein RHO25_012326 [Cercospora beticola]|uniref:Uncharacterized protein n=1 Tax=Cercospora beticola TaxID=122368 RepID=A0ABZ0P7X5_CERBT|nr:hypothetical protein RHO25_012326 [Cercospora beticola]
MVRHQKSETAKNVLQETHSLKSIVDPYTLNVHEILSHREAQLVVHLRFYEAGGKEESLEKASTFPSSVFTPLDFCMIEMKHLSSFSLEKEFRDVLETAGGRGRSISEDLQAADQETRLTRVGIGTDSGAETDFLFCERSPFFFS